jgi:hypothetical protein
MHPILHRVVDAYRPLAGRNRLVEGTPVPSSVQAAPPQRMALLALVAAQFGRRT